MVFVDHNKAQCYGPSHLVVDMAPLGEKWRSFGFGVEEVDGHDVVALCAAVARLPFTAGRPSVLICHTVKGKGLGPIEGLPDWHYRAAISAEDAAALRGPYSANSRFGRGSAVATRWDGRLEP